MGRTLRMTILGGDNFASEMDVEVTVIAPGVGEIVCPECRGQPEQYPPLFPPELGITHCVNCRAPDACSSPSERGCDGTNTARQRERRDDHHSDEALNWHR